jgi:hypothetical protein
LEILGCAKQRLVSRTLAGSKRKSSKILKKQKVAELQALVHRITSAYEKVSLSEISKMRHETHFSLFDDFPPFERLEYRTSLLHTAQIGDTLKNIRFLVDGVEVNLFRDFSVVSFYVKYTCFLGRKGISSAFPGLSRSGLRITRMEDSPRTLVRHFP